MKMKKENFKGKRIHFYGTKGEFLVLQLHVESIVEIFVIHQSNP